MLVKPRLLKASQLGIDAVDSEQVKHGDDINILSLPVGNGFQGLAALFAGQGAGAGPLFLFLGHTHGGTDTLAEHVAVDELGVVHRLVAKAQSVQDLSHTHTTFTSAGRGGLGGPLPTYLSGSL